MTDEPVRVNSARRRRLEAALLAGAPWPLAVEAASTVGLDRDAREQTYTLDEPAPAPERPGVKGDGCGCGEPECLQLTVGYPWCRPCAEHHRPPECAVDQDGYAIAPCGCRWADLEREQTCPHDA